MHNCYIVRDLLPMYADHSASSETSEAVRRHLATCKGCAEYYRNMERITRSMKNPPSGNRYRYSSLARKIRRRSVMQIAASCAVAAVVGYCVGKIMTSEGR